MIITKAIIHTLDAATMTPVISDHPINFNIFNSIETYFEKLVKGIKNSVSVSKTKLGSGSFLNECLNLQFNFFEMSKKISKEWFAYLKNSDLENSINLVVLQVDVEDTSYLAVFEVENKSGYIINTQTSEDIQNIILFNQGILPKTFSSIKSAFLLDLNFGNLSVRYNNTNKEFLSEFLDCKMMATAKESFKVVDSLVGYISEKRNEPRLENTIKARTIISESVELIEEIEPSQILKQIFHNLDDEELNVLDSSLEANDVGDTINLKEVNRSSLIRKHRIVTESGIEIILPIHELEVSEMVEINEESNGKISILLKNVGRIL